ncbi:MAG: hypothetical protein IJR44_01770 [Neisseriaceae bacterium]|nr:hypothetical protein [Neisseriaceae bacterium]
MLFNFKPTGQNFNLGVSGCLKKFVSINAACVVVAWKATLHFFIVSTVGWVSNPPSNRRFDFTV